MHLPLATNLMAVAVGVLPLQEAGVAPLVSLLEAEDERSALALVRQHPDEARKALAELFQLSMEAPHTEARVQRLLQAEQLARIHHRAWSDSLLVFEVERFTGWSLDERAQKLEADAFRRAGIEAFHSQGPRAAIRLWERALGQYRAIADPVGQAAALGNLGAAYYVLGQLDRSLQLHGRALDMAEQAGDRRTQGSALGNLGNVHRDRGDYGLAAQYYARALQFRRGAGDRQGEAADLNNLGLMLGRLGDPAEAEAHFRRALVLNRADGRARAAATNLTNLGNLAVGRGELRGALDLYSEALSLRRGAGDRQGEALDLENLGLLHLRWGDYRTALRSFEESLAIAEGLGIPGREAELLSHMAATYAAMGQLGRALETLDAAGSRMPAGDPLEPVLGLQRADLMAELHELDAAMELYRRASAGFDRAQDHASWAEAEQGLAHLHLNAGDCAAAAEALARVLAAQQRLPDARPAAFTRALLGDAEQCRGETGLASDHYQRALAMQQALGDVVAQAATLDGLAYLERGRGDPEAAVGHYREALDLLGDRPALPVRWHLHYGLGLALRDLGRTDPAAEELRAAVALIESVGSGLLVEERRYGFLEDKWHVYAELAQMELAAGRIAESFALSERMRAGQLLDLLARGRTAGPASESRLVRQEEDLRRQIALLATQLGERLEPDSGARGPAGGDHGTSRLRETLAAARARYERLLVELKEARPEYASLVTGETAPLNRVQALLPADAILIEYLMHDRWTIAFVVSKDHAAAVELQVGRSELRPLVHFLRESLATSPASAAGGELWRAPLRRLHRELIAPLEEAGHLTGRQRLLVVPHRELHYVPFQALLQDGAPGDRFLVESFDIAYFPSASVAVEVAGRARRTTGRGLLAMAPQPDALPHSAGEVRAIGRLFRGSTVLEGPAATESRFAELAPGRHIVHLASSAVLNTRNPLFSYVQLHPGQDTDGRLEVHEIFGLPLNAELVVLSACETGLGAGLHRDVPAGDDWVGLTRAFLYAGAGSVVASLWAVDDHATRVLMEAFYARLRAGVAAPAALAQAQRLVLRQGRHRHPHYWAAFGVTGGLDGAP
jgi:CHAT domain-containing protein/tetratricopeptide (TPR) repeat protein